MFALDIGRFLWVVLLLCLIIEIALVYLDVVVNWQQGSSVGAIRRLFDITREDGLASLFAVLQTFVVAAVVWINFAPSRQTIHSTYVHWGWLLLALFFNYMAIDDGTAVHERLGTAADTVAYKSVGWFPSYTWQLVIFPFFAGMGLFILMFLWRQFTSTANRMRVLAALACLALAVGMDFFEGLENGYQWLINQTGWRSNTIEHFSKSIEEFLEMFAMTLLLISFIAHLAGQVRNIKLEFHKN